MADIDVDALLDSTSQNASSEPSSARRSDRGPDRGRDKRRNDSKERLPIRTKHRDEDLASTRGSANGDRHRSQSRDSGRRHRNNHRNSADLDEVSHGDSDRYRGPGRRGPHLRARSRSPISDSYRPDGRSRREHNDRARDDHRYRDRDYDRRDQERRDRERNRDRNSRNRDDHDHRDQEPEDSSKPARRREPSPRRSTPQATDDERDRRTVFCQQLAARLRSKELVAFFEKVGPVKEAQIVKDRVSNRSKGVGYVEFLREESVQPAIQLTGRQLLGIPIIVQLTEAEKNRQSRNQDARGGGNGGNFFRLYVGNVHFSIDEHELNSIFDPFGVIDNISLAKDEHQNSRGYGFVQYRDADSAKAALENLNGFELAGRSIRVGLGNDKAFPESMQATNGQHGSSFSGSGGRGASHGNGGFDRVISTRDDKAGGGASALDDTDVAGINNFSRDALMRRLAREEDYLPSTVRTAAPAASIDPPQAGPRPSRCIKITNAFDPAIENAKPDSGNWAQEIEEELKEGCNERFGNVVHISLQPNSAGEVYVKFSKLGEATQAIQGLNGRNFNERKTAASYVIDHVYSSLFPSSRNL
ncbi:MAG: hypothetical protein M1820_005353 [Bogoriella megaspora]|nr:MAG: hypothetical protein M1820_005353 [Bogoriella megaspora]